MHSSVLAPFLLLCTVTLLSINPERTRGTTASIGQTPLVVTMAGSSSSTNQITGAGESSTIDTTIKPADANTAGIRISSEGTNTKISGCIDYSGGSDAAIVINVDNTTLDLDGRTIRYTGNRALTVQGIRIAPGVKNTLIKNGTIADFPGSGIVALGTTEKPIQDLKIKNISITGCDNGINCYSTVNALFSEIKIYKTESYHLTVSGIKLTDCFFITLNNIIVAATVAHNGISYGFSLSNCSDCTLSSCTTTSNKGFLETTGFYIKNCNGYNILEHCKAYSSISLTEDSHGFLVKTSSQVIIESCKAINNHVALTAKKSYGFKLNTTADCFLLNNEADRNDYGFYTDETNNNHTTIFTGNIARQNTVQDFIRPYSIPFNSTRLNTEFLREGNVVSQFDNVSIRTD